MADKSTNTPLMPAPIKARTRNPKPRQQAAHKKLAPPSPALNPEGYGLWIACDWADSQHEIVVWHPAEGLSYHSVQSQPEALQPFLTSQEQRVADGLKIGVLFENHRGSFGFQIADRPRLVAHPINPKAAAKYRQALHPSGAKSDPIDRDAILRFGLTHLDLCPAVQTEDALTRTLAALSEDRRRVVGQRVRISNQLTAVLKAYFPQALELAGDLNGSMAADFLEKWPTLQKLQAARESTVKTFYHQHNSRRPEIMETRLALIKAAVALSHDETHLLTCSLKAVSLSKQMRVLSGAIAEYDRRLEELAPTHPDYEIFRSVPGAGACLTPRLIALFGTRREQWPNALSLLTHSGVAPITISSGKETGVFCRWACPKFDRQTLVELAACSINVGCPWAVAYRDARKADGVQHQTMLRGLAFKWGRVLWKLWKTKSRYDEALRPLYQAPE
jgi:transposase